MSTGHDRVGSHFLEYRRYASAVGIHLNCGPRIGFRSAGEPTVLGFDPNEIRIAAREALPIASSRVVTPAGCNHLLEWLLTSVVGLGWAESDEEAMRLQVAISPRVEARLDELLGHPEICPHGNPIDAATAKRRPVGVRLSDTEAGMHATVYRITEEAEEDAGLLSYLEARALRPGALITVLARSGSLDSLTLEGPRGRATLGLHPAALVHVLRGEADPALFHTVPPAAN